MSNLQREGSHNKPLNTKISDEPLSQQRNEQLSQQKVSRLKPPQEYREKHL